MIKRIRLHTQKEKEAIEAVEKYGSQKKAAQALGISRSSLQDRLYKASTVTEALVQAPIPDGMIMTKTTVQYDAGGTPIQEWRRLSPQQEALEAFVNSLIDRVPLADIPNKVKISAESGKLLEVDIPDPHIGMYAWADMTGDKAYDVNIAKDLVLDAVRSAVASPKKDPDVAMLGFLGDIMHADNRSGMTEKSGNVLDVDGRYQRVVDYTEQTITRSVDICLERCAKVVLRVIPGNHDWHTAICMARIMRAYYRNTDRVEVLVSPRPRNVYVWGKVLIGHAHGDLVKSGDWAKIIPSEFPQEWAQTTFRYMHLGHIHKAKSMCPVEVDGQTGLTVEFLRALCPPDAWHCENGYVGSLRGADSFLYDKDAGMIERYFYNSK